MNGAHNLLVYTKHSIFQQPHLFTKWWTCLLSNFNFPIYKNFQSQLFQWQCLSFKFWNLNTYAQGSPGFQPPEQLRAESVGVSCEIYAFGGVLAVLLGGQVLRPGLTPHQIMHEVTVAEERPPLAQLPNYIRAISRDFLSKCSGHLSIGHALLRPGKLH